ncbi:MAG: DUF4411 family protein [Boseongicola sp. SB0662_bin_57]|nr:DUF4411 family protein [Boseongicola sp. SB0662_bin_57]
MVDQATYLVDSDVLITAKNLYYAFELCPGFWKSLLHHHREGRVFSVDRVRNELLIGRRDEDLFQWVKNDVPEEFFLPMDTDELTRVYTEIMMWVQRHPNYFDHAKAKFATGADGWLVACAHVRGATVVTNEQPAPASRRDVKLPDVCDEFKVSRQNTFVMLRSLEVRFDWTGGVE